MSKEIRSPNIEERRVRRLPFRHSDFVIPSDFVIRHWSFSYTNLVYGPNACEKGKGTFYDHGLKARCFPTEEAVNGPAKAVCRSVFPSGSAAVPGMQHRRRIGVALHLQSEPLSAARIQLNTQQS